MSDEPQVPARRAEDATLFLVGRPAPVPKDETVQEFRDRWESQFPGGCIIKWREVWSI